MILKAGVSDEQGITSTYVENTQDNEVGEAISKDHLHIRGEYSKQIPL